jgi:hypothetical protein
MGRTDGGADMYDRMTLSVLVLVCGWLWSGVAHGECNSPGFNPSSNFCNGCRYETSLVTAHDQACARPYRPHASARDIEFINSRIVQRARHGVARVSANILTYRPAKAYSGPDDFVVEATYRQGQAAGKFYVHFAVTVQ